MKHRVVMGIESYYRKKLQTVIGEMQIKSEVTN